MKAKRMHQYVAICLSFLASFSFCSSDSFASVDLPPPAAAKLLPTPQTDINVAGDSVSGHRIRRLYENKAEPNYSLKYPYEPTKDFNMGTLPRPEAIASKPKKLSLQEAIAIALRANPAVKTAELQRILDKFGLETSIHDRYYAQWQPFGISTSMQNGVNPTWSATGGVGVTTLSGTNVTLTQTNNMLGGTGVNQLNITQPLIQNFGSEFNRIIYDNAIDTEKIARITFRNNVITSVVLVITDYYLLVQAYGQLAADKASLQSQEVQVAQSKLQVKVGQMAPADLLQQQETLEETRLQYVQQQNTLLDAYHTFLTSLGLPPTAEYLVDQKIDVDSVKIPSKEECVTIALQNNPNYRTALLQLNQTKRALTTAENARKWSLNVTSGVTLGTQRAGVGQPLVNQGTNPTLGIALSVPFDNVDQKQAVVQARIGIENAELQLKQTKETLVSTVDDDWETVVSGLQQIKISKLDVQLSQQTLNNAQIRFKYGKITMFEVSQDQTDLLSSQNSYISVEISYLNSIEALYQELGTTLDKWHIKLRY